MDIKRLIKKTKALTKAEKSWLLEQGARLGVEEPKNLNCPDCWRDYAVQVAVAMRESEPSNGLPRLRGMAAVNGVIFMGRIITNDTLDEETLEWMRKNNFPKQLLYED